MTLHDGIIHHEYLVMIELKYYHEYEIKQYMQDG